MSNLVEFLDSIGAHPSSRNKQDEWVMDCWECQRHLLFFNIDKVIGFCVYCNKTRTLFDISRNIAGVSVKDIEQFIEDHRAQELRVGTFRESMVNGLLAANNAQAEKHLVEMAWPEGYRSLEDGKSSVVGKRAAAYLTGRGFDLDKLCELQFGYCGSGYYSGRIIIPTFVEQTLVYWQARDFTGNVPIREKILNPIARANANGKSDVVFNYNSAASKECVVVVESWGSCLAVGDAGAAVNGKAISVAQLRLFATMRAKHFIVLFDHGVGADVAWTAAEALSHFRDTSVALLPYGDPNEVPKTVLCESIRNCVPYSKEAHIKYRLGGFRV